ncbi:SusD/RagB family nutrient-binding outer membrane lipoprotein [Parapedobacter deserti]|uniref:SusD/RagB family nutrient-binding outer membrane lipoprotein n=1 Tax=Parapedobacter deserti TaxID=1912957 RepID=A0ABV7JLU7_9SPHI
MKQFSYKMVNLLAVGLLLSGCTKFGDTNIDPTRSSNLDPNLQLSLVQARFSGDLEINEKLSVVMTMPLVQHIGGIWANRYGQMYIKSLPYLSSFWEYTYHNDILNIVDAVERTNGREEVNNLNAVCRIMKVYLFARLTDVYGDIPYSEAAKAAYTGITRPAYDRQEDIYADFFDELKAAAFQLDATKDPITGDFFYAGNVAAWRKFANSLRLRLAMRLVKRDLAKAQAEAASAYQDGVFSSNADMCIMRHENIQNDYVDIRGNGVSVGINQHEVVPRLSNTLISQLRNTNDPRLMHIARYYIDIPYRPFDRVDITEQVRAVVGITGVNPPDYIWDDWKNPFTIEVPGLGMHTVTNNEQKAQLANFLIRNDAPFFHQTYAEVEFLLAEAALRFGAGFGDDVQTHYQNGIRAALEQLSLFPGGPTFSETEISSFIQSVPLLPGRELEVINTQLWVALFLNGPEAYANWRRSGYPVLPSSVNGESNSTTTPRRFEYPLSEQEQNGVNYQAAVERLGGSNSWNGRVWWDAE